MEDNAGRTGGVYRKTLDLGAYAKGVYILQIQTENGIVSRRLSLM
ncbi:MAG: T9SS type A sorting domain-containing protein [Schleiferiaceae bacterium]|nr:T9SS type A sorting domain-containing protein [Schleiferiaceae bacterium]